ncbi:MAG TPA: capsular biosynthesis protein [Leucothrix mucor]|nr:capsular biosynthesis protein [Leucothrix mucor]
MARLAVIDGISVQACTPHIYPGAYDNNAQIIQSAMDSLQSELDAKSIPLKLVIGADTHMVPEVMSGLKNGRIPCLNNSQYFLLEPSHHVPVLQFVERTVNFVRAGYTPLITHPERLGWLDEDNYSDFVEVAKKGAWIQITAGAIEGRFGKKAKYWAEKFLGDGLVHVIATDAHGVKNRPPILSVGVSLAENIVGQEEANKMVNERPQAIIDNIPVVDVVMPQGLLGGGKCLDEPNKDFFQRFFGN